MNNQHNPHAQDAAAMPVDYDAAPQQQQHHPQVHLQMPAGAAGPTNASTPQVHPAYATHTPPGPQAPPHPYGQGYAPPGYQYPQYPQAAGAPQVPLQHPGYTAQGPFGPTAPPIPSVPVPHMAMPPGVPPLMSSRQALQWQCLNEDLMAMVHADGCATCAAYGRHIGQAVQSDPSFSTANAAALRDRQVRMHEFFRQHTLSEGGGRQTDDLSQEVDRLREDRDRLREDCNRFRREAEQLREANNNLETRLNEAWKAADHYKNKAERTTQDSSDRRDWRRSQSPHHDSGRPRAPARNHSPRGQDHRRIDDRRPASQPHSSRGGSLQPPSKRLSVASPSTSHQPAPSSSAPKAGPSRPVHGADVAYDSEEWDNDDGIYEEDYDSSEGWTFKGKARAGSRRSRKMTNSRPRLPPTLNYGQPAPPSNTVTGRLANLGPSFNPALDPPRVPGGVRPPNAGPWPIDTDRRLADQWSAYVPMTIEQYQELVRSAKDSGSGARQRVEDLLYQYDHNGNFSSLGFLYQLKLRWNQPNHDQRSSAPRGAASRNARSPQRGQAGDRPGIPNPSRTDPPEAWMHYWALNPSQRPSYLEMLNEAPFHRVNDVRGHLLLRQILPRYRSNQVADRANFVHVINLLFSIPGLYRLIIERGAYPQGGQERFEIYPVPTANASIFDVAGWFARCGLTEESIELMRPMAVRQRHEGERRPPGTTTPFTTWPARLSNLGKVAPFANLAWANMPTATEGDASMDEIDDRAPTTEPTGPMPMDESPDPVPSTTTAPGPSSTATANTAAGPASMEVVTGARAPANAAASSSASAKPNAVAVATASSAPGKAKESDDAAPSA